MQDDISPTPLLGLEDIAGMLQLPPRLARAYLTGKSEPPVATYHGRDLWLADTVHDMLAGA
jgi:hypothetical protein